MKRLSVIGSALGLASMLLIAAACAPKAESLSHSNEPLHAGPRLEDTNLKLGANPVVTSNIEYSSDVSAAVVYRMTENLLSLNGVLVGQPRSNWVKDFLSNLPHTETRIADSAYSALLVDKAKPMADKALSGIIPKINAASGEIDKIISNLGSPAGDKENVNLDELSRRGFRFLHDFDKALAKSSVMPEIVAPIHKEMLRLIGLQSSVNSSISAIEHANTIRSAVNTITSAANDLKFNIESQKDKLNKARNLGAKVDAFADEQGALSVLIDVWNYLDAKSRVKVFQTASPELYNYLSTKSQEDLRCLQRPECFSLPKWFATKMVILPKITSYGVENIRAQVNGQGAAKVREEVVAVLTVQVRKLPQILSEKIKKEIDVRKEPILKLASDFSGEVSSRLSAWAKKGIEKDGGSVLSVRPSRAHLKIEGDGSVEVSWTQIPKDTMENSGALAALLPVLWRDASISAVDARKLMLSRITSLANDFRSGAISPDDSTMLSARAYAEAVRGYANLAIAFREWQSSSFESLLGTFRAKDLFPEFDIPQLDTALFPKDAFFALSFRDLAENLKSVKGHRTQIFLIDAKSRVTLANHDSSEDDPPVMAGIADRKGDQLATTVRAEDVARYLLAMCQVLDATKNVETTKSTYLLEPGDDGLIPRDVIVKSRDEIRMLILGLSNYLSHQFRAGGDLIHRELVIDTQAPFDPSLTVMDQMLAIRALVAASEALGIDLYRWEAIDLVSAINRDLYRADLGFYARQDEKTVSPLTVLEGLRAFDAVSPYLRPESREQIAKISSAWRQKVASWHMAPTP
jgi:hypothetical protein